MSINRKSEIAYLIQNVLPVLSSQYDFPLPEDEDRTKIDEIPVRMGSSVKKPDVVYYWNGAAVFLVEAKREGKSESDAVEQALSYIKTFPTERFSKDGIRPRYFAVTIGKQINFYAHYHEIDGRNNLHDWYEKLDKPITFAELLKEYGLKKIEKKKILDEEKFRKEFINELAAIYGFGGKITPEVVKNVSQQILSFFEYGNNFVSHLPYVSLDDRFRDRQTQIRKLFNKFDLISSSNQKTAGKFREFVLRAFQGGGFNQYMTEQCIIDFMWDLVGKINPKSRVLDFECGSGGFLAAAVVKNNLSMRNILGIDIDEFPYTVAKTYLTLYFPRESKKIIEKIILNENGLYNYGENWDVVISNPAGGSIYKHGNEKKILQGGLQNLLKKKLGFSEYELSIQQAVRSVKIGGKLCLILPKGFFSNSHDDFLRKFVTKYCRVLAIISLPSGVFRVGTSVKGKSGGSHVGQMKMSIIYAKKIKEMEPNIDLIQESGKWGYPIFMSGVEKPQKAPEEICDWLKNELGTVFAKWKVWQKKLKN